MLDLAAHIEALIKDTSLLEEIHFDRRADVLEDLDAMPLEGSLWQKADTLRARLERIDECLFEKLRNGIRNGTYELRDLVDTYVHPRETGTGYDNLDLFVNRLLSYRPLPEQTMTLEPDMVYFQKTPARIVFDMVGKINLASEDVFIDLGSGNGQVVLLVHLLTGVHARGIEYDPTLCAYAQDMADSLRLPGVSFDNADVREADLSQGTVFFMFTPFTGNLLHNVLERLKGESRHRSIRVITYGPCTAKVPGGPGTGKVPVGNWLTPLHPISTDAYTPAFFQSL
ncbi:class I SAM-dependent methyltransferase [Dinghuibacter silviterrae]|uniref:Histone-lysine N-methyltransferase, H3 lysine-79 specific n=1 Tax=Dinghuibacter silviterrae TaxID=1539049 RepID=A0A4R8DMC0_9BACT|nr:hypothetical protein [Dinghuibacter silviterrae]TDW99121.1 histone methylation protein DOT1 [Dinghuibacter silviterrae]